MKRFAVLALMLGVVAASGFTTANAECYHQTNSYRSNNASHCIEFQYKDSLWRDYHENYKTTEAWAAANPWSAPSKWEAATEGTVTATNTGWSTPYSTSMVYRDPNTGLKRCFDTSEAKQMKLKSTDAIRPCDQ